MLTEPRALLLQPRNPEKTTEAIHLRKCIYHHSKNITITIAMEETDL